MPTVWLRAKRDWRVRTMLPVVAIHVGAFTGLYFFTYEFALNEIKGSFRVGAAYVLEEAVDIFSDSISHGATGSVQEGLEFVAKAHKNTTLAIFSNRGDARAEVGPVLPFDASGVREFLDGTRREATWFRRDGDKIIVTGVQTLRNEASCRRCHATGPSLLGVIGVQRDLGDRVRGTAGRLRRAVGAVFAGWVVLLGLSYLIRDRVIGQPLAQIERTVRGSTAGGQSSPSHDLDGLVGRVDRTIWSLIQRQQLREREFEKGMERATQLSALGDVAAGLSHEIKNPLAGLRAALEALRHDEDLGPGERQEVVEQMISEVDRVHRTVDSLLSLARPRSLMRTPTDLGRLVPRATALLDARARESNVTLFVRASSSLPSLELDADLIIQVVVNLVTNALDAVSAGGHVSVFVDPFPENDGVVVAVSDDGPGIPDEQKARIFEPFFTTKHGGTGLGLPLCLRVVERHGGTITVDSGPGRGTSFVVLLPVRQASNERKAGDSGVHPPG